MCGALTENMLPALIRAQRAEAQARLHISPWIIFAFLGVCPLAPVFPAALVFVLSV